VNDHSITICSTIATTAYYEQLHRLHREENISKVTSVRLTDDAAEKLDRLAASPDRPKAWLIEQAIDSYLEEQSWQIAAIEETLAEYGSGTATPIPHEEVEARMEELLRLAEQR
jgi:predicted transcriptional regulator